MNSLRDRLTWRLLLGTVLLVTGAGAALHWQVHRALTAQFDANLRLSAQALTSVTEQRRGNVTVEFTRENLPQFEAPHGSDVFLISTVDGREVGRSRSLGTASLPLRVGTPAQPEIFDTTLPDGRILRCAGLRFTPLIEDEEVAKPAAAPREALVVVGRDRAPLDHILAALRASLFLVGGVALAFLAVLVRWQVRHSLAPLDALAEDVAAIDAASLDERFPVASLPDELRPISTRLNELLARLESAFARERRFTATAAHELRTPLAELRTAAEVNLAMPPTGAESAESWRDALATTLRMESLALRLLDLTRTEDSSRVVRREPVSLSAAVDAALAPWASRAAERRVGFEVDLPGDLRVESDPTLLGIVLDNLCANAAAHASAGTPVWVSARRWTDAVTLHFRNRADDLVEADIPHLFERFWRKDTARADGRHHGLGLSIAADFAHVVGGGLTAHLSRNGELEIALRLPFWPGPSGAGHSGSPAESPEHTQIQSPKPASSSFTPSTTESMNPTPTSL